MPLCCCNTFTFDTLIFEREKKNFHSIALLRQKESKSTFKIQAGALLTHQLLKVHSQNKISLRPLKTTHLSQRNMSHFLQEVARYLFWMALCKDKSTCTQTFGVYSHIPQEQARSKGNIIGMGGGGGVLEIGKPKP